MNRKSSIAKELHRLDISIGRRLCQHLNSFGQEELSGPNGRIIRFLSEHEHSDVFQRDLEKEFGITRSTASRVLTLMEHKGLVVRTGVTHDARLKKLTLTDKARGINDMMKSHMEAMNQRLLEGFSDQEQEQLFAFIDRMQKNLQTQS